MGDLLECTCIDAYKIRNMRDPNCCACSCNYNDLVEQLAKANERIEILEKERDHSQRMYNSLLGDLSVGYGALSIPECESHLRKFAIEQQVKALDKFYCLVVTAGEPVTAQSVRCYIEQLRKELEND